MTKAIIDFSGYTAAELSPVAHTIHDQMTANAATFTTPPMTMATLATDIGDFDMKLNKKSSGAQADLVMFNVARNTLETNLSGLGNYVNIVANGDPAIVVQSGIPSYETARTPDTAPPAAPQDLFVRQGDVSGTCVARYQPDRQHSINEVQVNTSDPNTEANWKSFGMYSGGKANLAGFTAGTVVWVRVRTVGLKGVMGAWSDPAKIMVV
jgi:hypothetical protein